MVSKQYISIPVQGLPKVFETNDEELDQLQERCGGYIEGVSVRDHILYCNERGRLEGLPLNLVATGLAGQPILGNAVLVGPVDHEGDTASCSRPFIDSLTRVLL